MHAKKRTFDFISSLILLVLLSPLLLIIWLIIKATSSGPGFYIQPRVGLKGRLFDIYKFRSMVQDAENMQPAMENMNETRSPAFKMRQDPSITPIGRVLRRYSIDELPQLLNVAKGEMSLVGPRPLPVRDYYNGFRTWQATRLSIKPGITCLWQISGRAQLSYEKWKELDLEYIRNPSFSLDLRILARTLPAVLGKEGSY